MADTLLPLECTSHPGGTAKLAGVIFHLPPLDKLQPVGKMSWAWSEDENPQQPPTLDNINAAVLHFFPVFPVHGTDASIKAAGLRQPEASHGHPDMAEMWTLLYHPHK